MGGNGTASGGCCGPVRPAGSGTGRTDAIAEARR
jgi:hypothetical protein